MIDIAHAYTDKQIQKLEHEIEIVYKQAEIDIRHKMTDFEKRYRVKENIHKKEVKQGKMTQEQFDDWKKGQVFQREQWNAKRESVLDTMHKANQIAVNIINGQTTNVFAVNANYMSYSIEHEAGVNFGFGLYDSASVVGLIKDNPQLLPKWKISEKKDYTWSQKKLNRAVTQGIVQGESIQQIADRLSNKLVSSNKDKMLTFARTAMTGAQNSGRLTSMKAAKDLGIDLEKEWMATLDSHTRDSHADIDGEHVPVDSKFSNGLQYPGEAGGAPAEVYNCRCTMVSNVKKYPAAYKRYDNIDGKPIENMTYKDWAKAKGADKTKKTAAKAKTTTKTTAPKIDYSKFGGKEIYDIMSKFDSYDDFFDRSTLEEWDTVARALKGREIKELYRQGLKPTAVKPTTSTTKATTTAKATTAKTTIEGAVPRTASYIDDVTAKGIVNYKLNDVDKKINKYIDRVAADIGVASDEAKAMIETGLKRIIDESEFTMRIRARNLEKVLDEGYFKNQHETGSSGGCLNTSMRKDLENKMFNVPKTGIADADRPVYGMFCPRWDANNDKIKDYYANGAGSWYGDGITVVLKKEKVINDATMTIGDSLDYKGSLVGTEVNNISYAGSYDRGTEISAITKLSESSTVKEVHETMIDFSYRSDHYFEYQLHGQQSHSANNIDYIVINERTANNNPNLLKKLDDKGIKYYINDA